MVSLQRQLLVICVEKKSCLLIRTVGDFFFFPFAKLTLLPGIRAVGGGRARRALGRATLRGAAGKVTSVSATASTCRDMGSLGRKEDRQARGRAEDLGQELGHKYGGISGTKSVGAASSPELGGVEGSTSADGPP